MSDLDDMPIVENRQRRNITNMSLKKELSTGVLDAIKLYKDIFTNDKEKTSDRLNAASKYVDAYLKIDKRIDEAALIDQQRRLNSMKINKAIDENNNEGNPSYVSPTVVSLEISDKFEPFT